MPEVEQHEEVKKEVALKEEALTVIEQAKAIKISDQQSYDQAAGLLLETIMPIRKKWAAYWQGTDADPGPVKLAYRTYQSLLDKFNAADKPMAEAEKTAKAAISDWDIKQEKRQQELQRQAQEAAEALEEEERLAAAVIAEESGASEEQVRDIVAAPRQAVAAPVAPTYQRASGIGKRRENWSAEVKDLKALVKAAAAGKVPIDYLLPNQTALNARAKADRNTMNIPGVIARDIPVISGRTK